MAVTTRPERAEIQVRDPLQTPLGQMIEPYRATLTPFLWEGITLEKVAAQLVLASRKTPGLADCQPEVLVDAICKALSFGGNIGQDVHIVPFKNRGVMEPTIMLDYKFKVELVVHAGGARSVDAVPVWEDELESFSIEMGSEPRITHRPSMAPPAGRKLAGAYAVAHFGQRYTPKILWMPIADIEAVRKTSRQWGPNSNPPVPVCPPWYAIKTVVHRLVKLLPKNPKLAKLFSAMDLEERHEFGDPEEVTARPAHVTHDGEDLGYTPGPTAAEAKAASDFESFPRNPAGLDDDFPAPPAQNAAADLAQSADGQWALAFQFERGSVKVPKLGTIKDQAYLGTIQTWAKDKAKQYPDDRALQELDSALTIVIEIRKREKAA